MELTTGRATQDDVKHSMYKDSQDKPQEEHDVLKEENKRTAPKLPPKPNSVRPEQPICKPRPPPRSPKRTKNFNSNEKKHDQWTFSGSNALTKASPNHPSISTETLRQVDDAAYGIVPQLHRDRQPHEPSPALSTRTLVSDSKQKIQNLPAQPEKDCDSESSDGSVEMKGPKDDMEIRGHPGVFPGHSRRAVPNEWKTEDSEKALKFCELGDKIKLKEFSCQKSVRFPCLLRITEGCTFLNGSEQHAYRADQLIVAIDVKTTDSVKIRDQRSGIGYDIPLEMSNSLAVALSSDPEWEYEFLLDPGYKIITGELLESQSLPRILQIVGDFTSDSGQEVLMDSLIFPQEVQWVNKFAVPHLMLVAKLYDGSIIHIPMNSNCRFRLSQSLKHDISLKLALKVLKTPFQGVLKAESNGSTYVSHVTTVEGVGTGMFLSGIMMKCQDEISAENISSNFRQPCHISIDIDLTVVRMASDEKVLSDIYKSAQLYYNLTESATQPEITSSLSGKTVQTLQSPVDTNTGKAVVTPRTPNKFQNRPLPDIPLQPVLTVAKTTSNLVPDAASTIYNTVTYSSIDEVSRDESHDRYAAQKPTTQSLDIAGTQQQEMSAAAETRNIPVPDQTAPINPKQKPSGIHTRSMPPAPVDGKTPTSTTVTSQSGIQANIPHVNVRTIASKSQQSVMPIPARSAPKPPAAARSTERNADSKSTMETNIDVLKKVDEVQILEMLDVMNLSAYKGSFQREFVNGELLSEMDDEMLKELGVQKAIHRKRLMRVIQGKDSIDKFSCQN